MKTLTIPISAVFSFFSVVISCTAILISIGSSNVSKEQYINEKSRIAELKRDPIITTLGSVDGCEVKYFNLGSKENSFYSTKCVNTVTITDASGKPTVFNANDEPEDEMNHRDSRKKMSKDIVNASSKL
jgi:ABC-type Fe3+-hydroxamate transport system substrate-binding protein